MTMFLMICIFVCAFVLLYDWLVVDPKPIFNKYRQKGKWYYVKYFFMRCYLYFTKKRHPFHQYRNENLNSKEEFSKIYDRPQPLSDSPWAFDAVFFTAGHPDGYYLAGGIERRKHHLSNGLLYFVTPEHGILSSSELPNTALYPADEDSYGAKGLKISMVEPMKEWQIHYHGKMRNERNPEKWFYVDFKATWRSNQPRFSYDTDLHPHLIASALALESWDKSYFESLKKSHQNHYEQTGVLEISFMVDNNIYPTFSLPAYRDHTFGKERDWNLMHRFSTFMIFLENGYFVEVGVVCQPVTCSEFYIGFVSDGEKTIASVEWCDFKHYQHGEFGSPPLDVAFQFGAGGKTYTVQSKVEHRAQHFKGFNRQIKMFENFVRCKVNGVPGVGVSEFCYHNETFQETEIDTFLAKLRG